MFYGYLMKYQIHPRSFEAVLSSDKITVDLFANWLPNNLLHLKVWIESEAWVDTHNHCAKAKTTTRKDSHYR